MGTGTRKSSRARAVMLIPPDWLVAPLSLLPVYLHSEKFDFSTSSTQKSIKSRQMRMLSSDNIFSKVKCQLKLQSH